MINVVNEDLETEILRWINVEIEGANFFGGLTGTMTNDHLKALFQKFYIDSLKHQRILEAIIRLLRAGDQEVSLRLHPDILDNLKSYLKVEEAFMKNAESLMRTTDDEIVKLLLKQIVDDEFEHHKMLRIIIDRNEGKDKGA